jgi:ribosome-associated translation inhibitor RaiA
MKTEFHFFGVNASQRTLAMLEPDLAQLQCLAPIDSAVVVVDRSPSGGPAFTVRVHLAVPGPDIRAEACDHTLPAAWRKVCRDLEKQIERRKTKQAARMKSNRQHPISATRWSRPAASRAA